MIQFLDNGHYKFYYNITKNKIIQIIFTNPSK